MGKGNVIHRLRAETCAKGASITKQDENKLRRVIANYMNYMTLSGHTIIGYSYGQDSLLHNPIARSAVFSMIAKQYHAEYGETIPSDMDTVCGMWSKVRKGNYKTWRDGMAVPNESHPLFGDTAEDAQPIAVVYAYWGRNQDYDGWLVKIGYTGDDLCDYLRGKEIQHSPKLLAHRCGGKDEEAHQHRKWRALRRSNREWFAPSNALFDEFARDWDTAHDFAELRVKIMKEWKEK